MRILSPRLLRWLGWPLISGLLALTVGCQGLPGSGTPAAFQVTQVSPGVFVHIGAVEDFGPANGGDVSNMGFIVGSRCVAVIDTGGTPSIGQALRAAVAQATPLPICYVINTHAHPDHMLGNSAFVDANIPPPQFVAGSRLMHTLAVREPYYRNLLQRDFGITLDSAGIVYPGLSVDKTMTLDLGDRILSLQTWPTAHTDNDLTVYDQRTRTLFTSDLLFVSHLPVLDGSLRGWMAAMAGLKAMNVATVVPGHGQVSTDWPGAMNAQASYLSHLLSDTRTAIAQQMPIQQTIDRISPVPASHWLLIDRFHRRNVTAAYAELEWEDDPPASHTAKP